MKNAELAELIRIIEEFGVDFQGHPSNYRNELLTLYEECFREALEQRLQAGQFTTQRESKVKHRALLFHNVGVIDGGGYKLLRRKEVDGVTVDIWQHSKTQKCIVGIPTTEYDGKDTRKGLKSQEEAQGEFEERLHLLEKRCGKRVWYPPYSHKVDLLVERPGSGFRAAVELEIARLRKNPSGLDAQSYSNFGEDVSILNELININRADCAIVFMALDANRRFKASELQHVAARCREEMQLINEALFKGMKSCYAFLVAQKETEFAPIWIDEGLQFQPLGLWRKLYG